ncbi:MAG: RAD55 family ATPase [Candidatus Micrarchaeota archaeon]|nr:RAD55 family ATPase [Candidatus Micrarchaeota archaeon]
MIRTGIPDLDSSIGGGLKEKSNVLVIGPPGAEKVRLALRFIESGAEDGDGAVYITTDSAPAELEEKSRKISELANKDLVFIDCYSWTLGAQQTTRKDIIVPGPSALNDLSIGIAQAMQRIFKPEKKLRVVVQSLSTLLLYNNPEVIYRFTQITGARLKNSNAATLFLIEEGMHDEKVVTTIKHLVDAVIEVKNENGKVLVRAPMNGLTQWKEISGL